ncbi:aminopeptidase P family protein [Candidatus Sumerlaeota bacterium]|nr:aminopeptidase P family protein [Candidatus Sumerlaeota bacterium]
MPTTAATGMRLKKLRAAMRAASLDSMIVLDRVNTVYLTGFECSYSVLIVDERTAIFVTDSRYGEAAEKALSGRMKVHVQPTRNVTDYLAKLFRGRGYGAAGFEGDISVDQYDELKRWTKGTKLKKSGELIMKLRRVKDDEEIRLIKRAVAVGDKLMEYAMTLLTPGTTELVVSQSVRFQAERLGASAESFRNIIASGPNSSRPHHHPGKRKLKKHDPVTVDLGVVYEGYCSDLTRTPVLGKPSKKFEEIYYVCLAANQEAIKAIRPGMTGAEADQVARNVIEEAGYGKYFGHGLGHGVGLQIHEEPRLSPRATSYKLEPGNIVTIEPGIYLPGVGGVRIEDYAVLTEQGAQVLSQSPKQLRILST